MTVALAFDGISRHGPAIDLRAADIGVGSIREAIATDGAVDVGQRQLRVRCPEPGPIHDRVGVVRPDRQYEIRTALATLARQRGYDAPQDPEISRIDEKIAAIDDDASDVPSEADFRAVRRRLAEIDGDTEPMDERIAALRGRIQALEERGADVEAHRTELQSTIRELTDAETDRIAAEQAFDRTQAALRDERDRRERRLQLTDRRRNLRRDARDHLAATLRPRFEQALAAVPGTATTEGANTFPTGPAAALAVCRMASLSAPVVVAVDRFPSAEVAADVLESPVVVLEA